MTQETKERTVAMTEAPPSDRCNAKCKPLGSDALPEGIISQTTDLEMQSLWGRVNKKLDQKKNLLAMPIGIKQKALVDKTVTKFIHDNFSVVLFHYDGRVDEWKDQEWHDKVIHISAEKQTKWWFAKRFLHPDIVDEYDYIFLWDEDLEVENFHPLRYLSIIKEEGLEISQPGLEPGKSEIHHQITVRNKRSRVHRRHNRNGRCDSNIDSPPCLGWVEMMAPVFSKAAWRCTWYMIQNDLIHAWGLDMQLGYCAQGDRKQKVGVVDEEYVAHVALPTLGSTADTNEEGLSAKKDDHRNQVRMKSYREMREFRDRWQKAVEKDNCWIDPYKKAPLEKPAHASPDQ